MSAPARALPGAAAQSLVEEVTPVTGYWPYSEPSSLDVLLRRLNELADRIDTVRSATVGSNMDSTKAAIDALAAEVRAREAERKAAEARAEAERLAAETAAKAAEKK